MLSVRKLCVLLGAVVLVLPSRAAFPVDTTATYSIFAEWTQLDYLWDAEHTKSAYLASGEFIPVNNALAGINVDTEGNVYVTVPRWKSGVPATLNRIVENAGEFVLSPWPSWDMQQVGVDGDLQNCQSMTIDGQGRMWVIEVGRRNFFDETSDTLVNGPAGLWMIDVASGSILSKYEFPADVVPYTDSFVNDLVLDQTKEMAYLTDAWGDGALIVYNFKDQTSRRYTGPSTMPDPNYVMIINGVNYGSDFFITPIDGIGITDDQAAIFYCNIQGDELHRVPTSVLNDFSTTQEEITAAVEVLGKKEPSDGMMYRDGVLYYGSLTESTYYALPITATSYPDIQSTTVPVWPQQVDFRWVDTFTRDLSDSSKFWFVSNSLDLFFTDEMDFTNSSGNSNFRVISATSTDTNAASGNGDDDDDEVETYEVVVIILGVLIVATSVLSIGLLYRMNQSKSSGPNASGLNESLM